MEDQTNYKLRDFGIYAFIFGAVLNSYLFFKSDLVKDKLFFSIFTILQLFAVFLLYNDHTENLPLLDYTTLYFLIISILLYKSKSVLIVILVTLLITLVSRLYFKRCLFFYKNPEPNNIEVDIFAVLFSLLILYKLKNPNDTLIFYIWSFLVGSFWLIKRIKYNN